jgi:hypothetical protein
MKPVMLLALSSVLLAATPYFAQAEASRDAKAQQAAYADEIRAALDEASHDNFVEAREHFRRAHAIEPNARTLRGLGMVEFELRNYAESVQLLEDALASKIKPLEGKLLIETETLLKRAREYIGKIQIFTEPKTTTLVVDGNAVQLDEGRMLTLPVGDHVFEFHAEGRLPARQTIRVNGGEMERHKVVLVPIPSTIEAGEQEASASGPDLGTRPKQTEATPLVRKWWLWTAVAVVVGGAATAAILLTRKQDEKVEASSTSNTPSGAIIKTLTLGGN